MPKFVHIDIAADDPQRAADFFSKVFAWSAQKLEGPIPYRLLSTSPSSKDELAIGAGVACREEPWQSVTPTIDVPSADEYADKITAAAGAIVRPERLIPGIGHLVTFKDTEGNVFAILEPVASNPFASSSNTHLKAIASVWQLSSAIRVTLVADLIISPGRQSGLDTQTGAPRRHHGGCRR